MSVELTATGRTVDLTALQPSDITTQDLAYGLAGICRFNGHSKRHYSVAQHSLLVAQLVPPEDRLHALLHDAPEYLLGDLVQPVKLLLDDYHRALLDAVLIVAESLRVSPELFRQTLESRRWRRQKPHGIELGTTTAPYRQLEAYVWGVICQRFDLEPDMPASVHQADMIALATERRDVMPDSPEPWPCLEDVAPIAERCVPWTREEAAQHYHQALLEELATSHRRRVAA